MALRKQRQAAIKRRFPQAVTYTHTLVSLASCCTSINLDELFMLQSRNNCLPCILDPSPSLMEGRCSRNCTFIFLSHQIFLFRLIIPIGKQMGYNFSHYKKLKKDNRPTPFYSISLLYINKSSLNKRYKFQFSPIR